MIKDYVCIDFETSGLNARRDRIIEIGCLVVKDGVAAPAESVLVRYDEGGELPAVITEITGLKAADLADGLSTADALRWLLSRAAGLPLVGHNIVAFDLDFLVWEAQRAHVALPPLGDPACFDTAALFVAHQIGSRPQPAESVSMFQQRVMARRPRTVRYNLAEACRTLGIATGGDDGALRLHRAAGDVTVTQQVFEALLARGVLAEKVFGEAVRW